MIVRTEDKHPKEVEPGFWRAILSHGQRIMVAEINMTRGAKFPSHQHPHEQITYVIEGTIKFVLDGEEVVLGAGESCLIRSGQTHSAEAPSDCMVLDIFSPPREDFLD